MRAAWIVLLLLPACAGAESQLATPSPQSALRASARVDFKLVIPAVIYLGIAEQSTLDGAIATIMSNGRSVTFSNSGSHFATAGRRQTLVEHTRCARDTHLPGLICTAAAP